MGGGCATLRFLARVPARARMLDAYSVTWVVTAGMLVLHVVVLLALIRLASPRTRMLALTALMATAFVLLGSNYWHSRPRLLLAAFLRVVPLAELLERVPRRRRLALIGAAVTASLAYGSYMMTAWPFAI